MMNFQLHFQQGGGGEGREGGRRRWKKKEEEEIRSVTEGFSFVLLGVC
jgi:hypothetical protein